MTGPPYPRYPTGTAPGENAIGSFVIGVSPIGTITPFDWWSTVISQYANSPIMMGVLESFFDAADQTDNFDEFFDKVFNILTAQGYGLDVWGRILGAERVLHLPNATDYLGFEEAGGNFIQPFNTAPFYSGSSLTSNFALTDGAYRLLLLAKAAANISDGSVKSINRILMALFPLRGNCYVTDNLNMSITYTFTNVLSPVELAIVQSGVLPKPGGVSSDVDQP